MQSDKIEQKRPPADLEAEATLLGSILLSGDRIYEATEYITDPNMFYLKENSAIFNVMLNLSSSQEKIDAIIVADKLKKIQKFSDLGGDDYIKSLLASGSYSASVTKLAQIIKENYILRELINISQDIMTKGYDRHDSTELLEEAEKRIFDLSVSDTDGSFVVFKEALKTAFESIIRRAKNPEDINGLPSGFKALDNMTTGFKDNDLILIAARPSMGKTALALNICQNITTHSDKVAVIFSLEMDAQSLVERMISSSSRVDSKKLKTGRLDDDDLSTITTVSETLGRARIFIDENSAVNITEMKSKLRKLKIREKSLDLVIIDYIQLMNASGKENRQQEIAYISRSLKGIAREIGCPVIALSQLSRASEKRGKNMKPMLSDLRDSGAIEQDADLVMFIHREEYYLKEKTPDNLKNVAEIIIAKHRNGEIGSAFLGWNANYTKFENIDIKQQMSALAGMVDE